MSRKGFLCDGPAILRKARPRSADHQHGAATPAHLIRPQVRHGKAVERRPASSTEREPNHDVAIDEDRLDDRNTSKGVLAAAPGDTAVADRSLSVPRARREPSAHRTADSASSGASVARQNSFRQPAAGGVERLSCGHPAPIFLTAVLEKMTNSPIAQQNREQQQAAYALASGASGGDRR